MFRRHLTRTAARLQENLPPVSESNLYKMADEYQRHVNHHHFNKERGNHAKAEFHRAEANKIVPKYHKAFHSTAKSHITPVKHPDQIKHIGESVNEDGGPSMAAKILARAAEKGLFPEGAVELEAAKVEEAKAKPDVQAVHALAKEHGGTVSHQSNQGHHHIIVHGFAHHDHAKAFADKLHAAGHKRLHITKLSSTDRQVHIAVHEEATAPAKSGFLEAVLQAAGKPAPEPEVTEADFSEDFHVEKIPKEHLARMHAFAKKMAHNGTTTPKGSKAWAAHANAIAKRMKEDCGVDVEAVEPLEFVEGVVVGPETAAFALITELSITSKLPVGESTGPEDHVVHVKYKLRSTEQAKHTVHHLIKHAISHGAHAHDAEGYDGDVKFHFKHHDHAKHFANVAKNSAHVHTVHHNKPTDEALFDMVVLPAIDEKAETVKIVPTGNASGGKTVVRVHLTSPMGEAAEDLATLLTTYGGKPSASGGYEFPVETAQSFLNKVMIHGGRGYIEVPRSIGTNGRAGPNESVEEAKLPGSRVTSHESVKPGDHLAWHGPLNGRTGTGPHVMHHGEVKRVEPSSVGGHTVHVEVHHINGKPAHEHLDGDRVYKNVEHERRQNVIHHAIHSSHFTTDTIHKV